MTTYLIFSITLWKSVQNLRRRAPARPSSRGREGQIGYLLPDPARTAFTSGEYEKTKRYATEMLDRVNKNPIAEAAAIREGPNEPRPGLVVGMFCPARPGCVLCLKRRTTNQN
jgi:hypothetical protein